MLDALKQSPEAGHLVREARKYLRGVKGTLVQKKKLDAEKFRAKAAAALGTGGGVEGYPGGSIGGGGGANGRGYGGDNDGLPPVSVFEPHRSRVALSQQQMQMQMHTPTQGGQRMQY